MKYLPITKISLDSQRGATLLVGLIMVLLITIIGLAAIRGSGLQEQMAGNMRDRHVAFEAAEAALNEGEDSVMNSSNPTTLVGTTGYHHSFNRPSAHFWEEDFNWDTLSAEYAGSIDDVSSKPRFAVEQMIFLLPGTDGSAVGWQDVQNQEPRIMYRITARGHGGNENTQVIVQSTVRTSIEK